MIRVQLCLVSIFSSNTALVKSLEERFESVLLVEARLGFNFKLLNFWHKRGFKMQILGDSLLEAETQHLQSKNRFDSFFLFFLFSFTLFPFLWKHGVVEEKSVSELFHPFQMKHFPGILNYISMFLMSCLSKSCPKTFLLLACGQRIKLTLSMSSILESIRMNFEFWVLQSFKWKLVNRFFFLFFFLAFFGLLYRSNFWVSEHRLNKIL